MDKFQVPIVVVPRGVLFRAGEFQGFSPSTKTDLAPVILAHHQFMRRGDAEGDIGFKQPVSYIILINRHLNKVFAYQRAVKDKQYPEKRLQGKWSIGIGGHMEQKDVATRSFILDVIYREMEEEFNVKPEKIEIVGFINDDSDSVGKVHIGVVGICYTDKTSIQKNDAESINTGFRSLQELRQIAQTDDIESWSKILIKECLSSLMQP